MNKKKLFLGSVLLGLCFLIVLTTIKINLNSKTSNNTDNSNKVQFSYMPNEEDLKIYVYDYNLNDKYISEQIDLAIKQLPHADDELFAFIKSIKDKLKHEYKFEYDDTGTYSICTDKRVGKYNVSSYVTNERYLGNPEVYIRIFK